MGDKSKIEWTDATWNPVTGCSPVSDGCSRCYASRQIRSGRTPAVHGSKDFEKVTFHPSRLDQPLRWKKPRRIFVSSMGDLFHEDVKDEWLDRVMAIAALSPRHTFMLLTKRPERMKQYMGRSLVGDGRFRSMESRDAIIVNTIRNEQLNSRLPGSGLDGAPWPLPNLWLGVTAENQEMADQRIPILLQTPAALRFVSIEPMLGPVYFRPYTLTARPCFVCKAEDSLGQARGSMSHPINCGWRHDEGNDLGRGGSGIVWVICGGESGPGARYCDADANVRPLVQQCQAAGVPCFVKQLHLAHPSNKRGFRVSKNMNEWPEDLQVQGFPDAG